MIHPRHFLFPSCIALVFACVISTSAQQENLNKDFLEAVQKRDVTRIQTLLSQGADVNAQEHTNGHFALQYAIALEDLNRQAEAKEAYRQAVAASAGRETRALQVGSALG